MDGVMRAALFEAYRQPLTVTSVDDPKCPADGVVVRVKACGVCRSDHHAWVGHDPDVIPPHVPGHEFAGVVEEVGPRCRRWKPGERVTAPFILACGDCAECLGGDPTVCDRQHVIGFSSWGAFAERIALPHADFNLVQLPDGLDFAHAAAMGCRVTTSFRALTDRARLQPGEWLAVHGCGGVGLATIVIALAMGARVVAVDLNPEALNLAKSLGADVAIDARTDSNVGQAVRDVTGGGAHVSIDALGITDTFLNSIRSLRKLGRHIQVGMPTGKHVEPNLPLLELVYLRQIAIMGTRGIPASRFPALLAMLESGRIEIGALITRRIGLDDAGAAIAAMDGYTTSGITIIDRF
jgi:alcohol dehydrogenase